MTEEEGTDDFRIAIAGFRLPEGEQSAVSRLSTFQFESGEWPYSPIRYGMSQRI